MIENKMKDAEFLQFADDLIDFYVYFIADRKQPTFRHQTVNKVIMYINDELENDLTVKVLQPISTLVQVIYHVFSVSM